MNVKRVILGFVAALLMSSSVSFAQDRAQTLADIRTELGMLNGQIQELRGELASTGSTDANATTTGPALLRLDAIEQELRRLTGQVEQLGFRVDQIVKDGTNRVGDLEFRLCELEEGCDVMQAGRVPDLGGAAPATDVATATTAPTSSDTGAELAVSERADFDAAFQAYQAGNYPAAADAFLAFTQAFPGGPLTGDALYWRGEALAASEDWKSAARSFLDSYSGTPTGEFAPAALHRLGVSLGKLDKSAEACQTLQEVGNRFPGSQAATDAAADSASMGCS